MEYLENSSSVYRNEWIRVKNRVQDYLDSLPRVHSIISALPIPYRYSGKYAMVPSNLRLESHIDLYPPKDYMFVEDNSGRTRSVNESGTVGSIFDSERLIYLIGLISAIPAKNKDSITEDGFVSIHSKTLRNFFKDYLCYLDYLVSTGILITDNHYEVNVKSKGYKFAPFYDGVSLEPYYYQGLEHIQETIPTEVYDDEVGGYISNPLLSFDYLSKWYETGLLTIEDQQAMEFAFNLKEEKIRGGRSSWDDNRDKSRNGLIIKKSPITQYNAALYNINAIRNKQYNVKIDSNVHRLHSVITNLQKTYRQFLRYAGEPLIGVDITNSQPYLLALILNPLFWEHETGLPITYYHLANNTQTYYDEEHVREIHEFVSNINFDERTYYHTAVSSGEFYETLMHRLNSEIQSDHQLSRDDVKTMTMMILFSSNKYHHRAKKMFRLIFPEIYELIKLLKKKKHNSLPCLLQNIESEIVLHRCCHRLWNEHDQSLPVFTIHDSICTTPMYVDVVASVMREELFNCVGIQPALKREGFIRE